MKNADVVELFRRLAKGNPAPQTELTYESPFTLLVAVVLSAQATDVGVNKATPALFKAANTPQKMACLGEAKIRDFIKTIGLFNTKAKNVAALSQLLIERHDGIVPEERGALEALPGVGRKTANVVMNEAFGHPTIAVDTHIFRVSNRTGLAPGKNPLEVEAGLEKVTPEKWKLHAHHWLLMHGRYTCKARVPECSSCHVAELCAFKGKTTLEAGKAERPAERATTEKATVAKKAATKKSSAARTRAR
jgi:endonuclease III